MNGLDDGRFLAYLDGELSAPDRAEVEAWLDESPAARVALDRVRRQADVVTRALAPMRGSAGHGGSDPTDVASAFQAVISTVRATERDRQARGRGIRSFWGSRSRLAQAATVVLFLTAAGVAAAIPGSPLRAVLSSLIGDGPTAEVASISPEPPQPEVGVRVAAADGRLDVTISGLAEHTPLVVRLVDGDRGAVFGPQGSRFLSGTGRIEASLPAERIDGATETPIRVEIPRGATGAILRVNGVVWLEKRGERLETPGRAARIEGDEINFRTGSGG